jgi:hypothetical protein
MEEIIEKINENKTWFFENIHNMSNLWLGRPRKKFERRLK